MSESIHKTILRKNPFGPVVVFWSEHDGRPRVFRIFISWTGLSAEERVCKCVSHAEEKTCPVIDALCSDISVFLSGRPVRFSLDILRLDQWSSFQQLVFRAQAEIPWARVSTYQHVAARIGKPGACRAVGNALAVNPFPIIIPCHRTVRSDRSLGGFQGGAQIKRTLLENEGIRFSRTGHIFSEYLFS